MNSRFVTVRGSKFHVVSEETGDVPIVMAHGFTDNWMCLRPVMNRLPDWLRVVSYDAKSHGLSDAPDRGYGKNQMAWDLVGIVDELGLENVGLYGHSLGANTVARASKRMDCVDFMILEDPAGLLTQSRDRVDRYEEKRVDFERWRTCTHSEILKEYKDSDYSELLATARKQMRPEALNIVERGYSYIGEILDSPSDTLVLRPDQSVTGYSDNENELVDEIRVCSVPNAGHTVFRDEPEHSAEFVLEFLSGIVSGR